MAKNASAFCDDARLKTALRAWISYDTLSLDHYTPPAFQTIQTFING